MKQITRYSYLSYLFAFKAAYYYTFFAGILVSVAVNLFTTALLTQRESLPIAEWRVHVIALSFLISSMGAFGVSVFLEASRSDWERDGAQSDSRIIENYAVEKHLIWKVLFLSLIIIGLASSIFWYSDTLLNYYRLFKIKG
ncbi:MAG: hypothetical protein HYV59_15300 [Planctomycetes bacterium]|nr:hypothetical protein [Planctomycetota bacterium]